MSGAAVAGVGEQLDARGPTAAPCDLPEVEVEHEVGAAWVYYRSDAPPSAFDPDIFECDRPPCWEAFLSQITPAAISEVSRARVRPKLTARVSSSDLGGTVAADFPVLQSLAAHRQDDGVLGDVARAVLDGDEPLAVMAVAEAALDDAIARVGVRSAKGATYDMSIPDEFMWLEVSGDRRYGLLLSMDISPRSRWVYLRRVEMSEDGGPQCLPVGIVLMPSWKRETIDWDALVQRGAGSDHERDLEEAEHLYLVTSTMVMEEGIDRYATEPFYGPRCLDLMRAAVALSPWVS